MSTTRTVIETELRNPVDWHATFFDGDPEETAADSERDAIKTHVVGSLTVFGDIPEEVAETVVTPRVEDIVASTDGSISVGDVTGNVVDDVVDGIDGEVGGMAGTLANGLRDAMGAGNDGPDRTVKHRSTGWCTDETELETRIEVVTTVADAVETSRV